MNDPRGSVWRKWDLHFHTPSSYDYKDKSVTNDKIINILKTNNVSVVAITDHFTIDTARIKDLKAKADSEITFLPGIELRSELGGSESVHFIGIFPEDLDIDSIWTKLQGKLNITPTDIAKIGNEKVFCRLKETTELIHELGGVVSIHAGSKTNTIENITNALSYKQAIKEEIVGLIDIYEVGKSSDIPDYITNVFPYIAKNPPLILCSDNHTINKYEVKTNLWIKADPTFKGLLQTIIEPRDRVFVGDVPSVITRVSANKTKYIKTVKINRAADAIHPDEVWFNNISLNLSSELVAIIGNKGNGKSALADIIGLVGNTRNYAHYSFLQEEKFREPRNNKAYYFEGILEWESGQVDKRRLSDDPEEHELEKVKYFPQKYLELLCSAVQKDEFERELKNVIFSHVPAEERLGTLSLDELIQYQGSVIDEALSLLKEDINDINRDIVKLEDVLDDAFIKTINEQLKRKQNELQVHEKSIPIEIKKPEADKQVEKDIIAFNSEIEALAKSLADITTEITSLHKKRAALINQKAAAEKVYGEVDNIKSYYEGFTSKTNDDFVSLGLKLEDIITIKVDLSKLDEVYKLIESELATTTNKLNPQTAGSVAANSVATNARLEELKKKLDEPSRRYHEYLKQLEEWEARKLELIGAEDKDETIVYYQNLLENIATKYPSELQEKRAERQEIVRSIYRKKRELLDKYKLLYKPVEAFVAQYKNEKYPINFHVTFELKEFYENYFTFISQKAKGSFCGIEEGTRRLRGIFEAADLNNEDAVVKTGEDVISKLEYDVREDKKDKRVIKSQIKREVLDFYNYLFSLDYLVPRYSLKLGETELSQLSSGEKGALLLIFYLLIDKNNVPLIMDQPEENLDNQSVYELLVHYIKEAKKRRQIIIVTHNPNLAVVCDAEQVIYAKIDKVNKNTVNYKSGSIENPEMNKKIIDVLEGTMPAFNNREDKYTISR
jgi:ABC-type lipoprotein export system ATPase subunit